MNQDDKPETGEVRIVPSRPKELGQAKQYLLVLFVAMICLVIGGYVASTRLPSPPPAATNPNLPTAAFGGIGAAINPSPLGPVIARAYPGMPAAQGGLQQGDLILTVGTADVSKLDVAVVTTLLRGPEGSTITLTYSRNGAPPQELTLTRAVIHPEVFQGKDGK